jgi:hypothetical protein
MACWALTALAVEAGEPVRSPTEAEAIRAIEAEFQHLPCGDGLFVFGVGSTDSSYLERLLCADGAGTAPRLQVKWRGEVPAAYGSEAGAPDLPPLSFLLELHVSRALQGVPHGTGWQLVEGGWQTSLRFKYTHWYGQVRRQGGAWKIDWEGYRRPLLPRAVIDRRESVCAMFQGR